MQILLEPTAAEIIIRNSRFLAEAFVVTDQEAARECLRTQKERYSDATHVVHAFVIGPRANILGCSDDGEPAGTAGRPALEVLKGSGITNVMVTVTRYFGGTKLGTGGLVKAYTEAVQEVLKKTKTEKWINKIAFQLQVAYAHYQPLKKLLLEVEAEELEEVFAEEVTIKGKMNEQHWQETARKIADLTQGKAILQSSVREE